MTDSDNPNLARVVPYIPEVMCGNCLRKYPENCEQGACIQLYRECMVCKFTPLHNGKGWLSLPVTETRKIQARAARTILEYGVMALDCPAHPMDEVPKDCKMCKGTGTIQVWPAKELIEKFKARV